ncbi:hypothetical protein QBC45DRAFT_422123 [Copromyces sp. CBS 386.78]|nr:hypothetical protein QBC45DRAFT_422123 [Copromyces sp. CBS 386.78]
MSSPAKAAQSPASEAASSPAEKGKSPTPGPASPAAAVRELSAAPESPTPAPAGQNTPDATGLLPGAHWAGQNLPEEEEEDADNDWDSALGSDIESSTASISSSILEYRTINGRTYYSNSVTDTSYWGPNDQKQNEILDIFHHTITIALNNDLYKAPIIDKPKNMLNISTGTGLWAMDFAEKFPDCNVIGTDVSTIQPTWVPPNVRFEIDDYNKE